MPTDDKHGGDHLFSPVLIEKYFKKLSTLCELCEETITGTISVIWCV